MLLQIFFYFVINETYEMKLIGRDKTLTYLIGDGELW